MKQLEIEKHPLYTLNPFVLDIKLVSPVCLDLETTGVSFWKDNIRLIAINSGGNRYLLQPENYTKHELTMLFKNMAECFVIAHNAKFDLNFIYYKYGVLLSNIFCTLVASQVAQGGLRSFRHSLDQALSYYLGIEIDDKKEMQKSFTNGRELTPQQLEYAIGDVEHLVDLKDRILKVIEERELAKVLALEMKLLPVLVKMENAGVLIDRAGWTATLREWEIKKKQCIADLDAEYLRLNPYAMFGNLNYASAKQVIAFFKQLGLPAPTKKERDEDEKESADEGSLDNYLNENPDSPLVEFIRLLKQFREYDKLLSTYGESFLDKIDDSGRIHTSYAQCSTTTGRLSSKEPNLQNIPSDKSGEGGRVRQYFIAPPGHKIVTCDMSKAEVVIAGDYSKDPLLVKSINEGLDMHSELASISASIIYGQSVKISDSKEPLVVKGQTIIPKEFRDIHKSVTFSKFYKGGPKRVYDILARYISPVHPPRKRMKIATDISNAIDKALPHLSAYLTNLIDQANTQKYLVTTKLGRRRYFDGKVYGEAANAPVQGSNADAMKIALVNIDKKVAGIAKLLMTVHDECVLEVREENAEDIAKMVRTEMANALTWQLNSLKGDATVKVSNCWEK